MKSLALYFTALLTVSAVSLHGDSFFDAGCWNPVFGIESGVAITSNAGRSKTFPADTPGASEFYNYSANHKMQTRGIYGAFLGAEWQGFLDWNLQLSLKYNQASPFSVNGTLTQGIDEQSQDTYDYKYKILIRQLLIESKLSYMFFETFRPYMTAGIGPSFNRAYSFSTSVPPLSAFTREYKNHSTTSFTYTVGCGVDFEICNCVWAGISYRFTNFGRASLGSASIDDVSVSGTLSQTNFYASEFAAQLLFAF